MSNGTGEGEYYSTLNAMWPDLWKGRVDLTTARVGVNRETGAVITGWPHVEQSMRVLFMTPFHQRGLRRWVGSFVPHILGESLVARVITRFYWAIITAIDLWEPGYRVRQVYFMGRALQDQAPMDPQSAADLLRLGHAIFRQEGVFYPRGHLGDFTPYESRGYNVPTVRSGASMP